MFMLVHGADPDAAAPRLARAVAGKVCDSHPWIRRLDKMHELIRTNAPADRMIAAHGDGIDKSPLK